MDDRSQYGSGAGSPPTPGGASSGSAGFCQECGRPLTVETVRRIANGVYCPTCAIRRPSATAWQTVHAGPPPGAGRPPRPGVPTGEPNPVLAGIFGAVPGVGAMYNGQYAKGAMHLLVFVVLVTLADNLNWVLWWLVWGWIFYQIFEAYHTARARRDHLPLPNAFGWNDLGERFGFHRASTPEQEPPVAPFTSRQADSTSPWVPEAFHTESFARQSPPPNPAYNPYTAPVTPRQAPVVPISPQPATSVPYSPTYTGSAPGQPPAASGAAVAASSRFPAGALWLIGFGGLFLIGNVLPAWRLSGRWMAPLLLAVVAAWSALRRWNQLQLPTGTAPSATAIGAMSGPIILGTIAALLAFQAAGLFSLRRSWPILMVIWGSILLVRRTAPAPPLQTQSIAPSDPVASPARSTSGTGSYGL